MDSYNEEEVDAKVQDFLIKYSLSKNEIHQMKSFFQTCDDSVFSLPTDTAIRRAYTFIKRK